MNILLIVLLAALVAFAVWRTVLRSRRGGGCCGEHEAAEKKIVAADRNKAHYPFSVSMKIGGMTCPKCVKHVKSALEGVAGVEEAIVDLDSGTAVVKLSADVADEALIAAVVEEEYEAAMA